MILRKGVYPYEYMTNLVKLEGPNLPSKEAFGTKLSEGVVFKSGEHTPEDISKKEITDEDYKHAQKVFKELDCKNLGDYTKLYCKPDVFENFINVSLKRYGLDPSHYITAPSLAMDAMLKMTGVC